MHLNDNYRDWDDDMLVGSIHIPEYLELAYWLRKLDYQGWLTLDIFPYRELAKVSVAEQCKKNMEFFLDAVDRVGLERIDQVVASGDALAVTALVREELLSG
jgi:xylose isomerase